MSYSVLRSWVRRSSIRAGAASARFNAARRCGFALWTERLTGRGTKPSAPPLCGKKRRSGIARLGS